MTRPKKTPKISVIVCTLGRPIKLKNCIDAIFTSATACFNENSLWELIVIDQSEDEQTRDMIKQNYRNIIYKRIFRKGISLARNSAIKSASANVLAFTDDDCIVDPSWISNILFEFDQNAQIDALFGWVSASMENAPAQSQHGVIEHKFGKSYFAFTNQGHKCFALILENKERIISSPCLPHTNLGSSNNMACRREFFLKYGLFSLFFGAGSLGYSAEDTEIAYRALLRNACMKYSPKIRVYHNNWLASENAIKQVDRYLRGMAGVFAFYMANRSKLSSNFLRYVLGHIRQAPQTCIIFSESHASIKAIFRRYFSIALGLIYGLALSLILRKRIAPKLT